MSNEFSELLTFGYATGSGPAVQLRVLEKSTGNSTQLAYKLIIGHREARIDREDFTALAIALGPNRSVSKPTPSITTEPAAASPKAFLCDDPGSLCDDPNSVLGE